VGGKERIFDSYDVLCTVVNFKVVPFLLKCVDIIVDERWWWRRVVECRHVSCSFLGTLATDPPCQLDVLGHNGHSLGVDGAQVGVLEQTHQVGLRCFLKGANGRALESQVGLEVLSDLTNQTLEWQLADQQLGGLLVATDLTESDGSGPVPVGLLDTTGGWGRLPGGLGGQLLPGGLASGRLTCGLLGTSHDEILEIRMFLMLTDFQTLSIRLFVR